MAEINNSDDIINILFNYINENFDKFGHNNWWKTEKYGGSWSPFVETCFMLEAMKYGDKYKILCCYSHEPITNYIHDFYSGKFPADCKYPCRDIDVAWLDKNNTYFLAVENSEDIPTEKSKIDQMKYLINYSDKEDENVEGIAKDQLIAIRDEINKLKGIKSSFKVLISRPHPFDKVNINNRRGAGTYRDSVNIFKELIEKDLKKDADSFNEKERWVIILITPDPDRSRIYIPNQIIFHCYQWNGKELSDLDPDHTKYVIPIQEINGKWEKQ